MTDQTKQATAASAVVARTNTTMDAYDRAQEMMLAGIDRDGLEMTLVREFPDVNAKGLVPTVIRRAARDLAEL